MGLQNLLNMFKEKPVEAPVVNGGEKAPAATPWSDPNHPANLPGPVASGPPAVSESTPVVAAQAEGAGTGPTPNDGPLPDIEAQRELIIRAIRTIFDPEIPVNIYDLGLIYEIHLNDEREALIRMTLTAPNCPSAEELPVEVQRKTAGVAGVTKATVELVWEPSWNKDMMSDVARLELGM